MNTKILSKLMTLITGTSATLLVNYNNSVQAATIEYFDQSSFANNSGDLTLINFDNLAPGAITGNEFISQGLTIVQRDGFSINVVSAATSTEVLPTNVNSFPNVISSSYFVGGGYNDNISDNYDFILMNPVFAAGLYIGNISSILGSPTQVQFLNVNGDVIAEEIFDVNHPNLIGVGHTNNRIFYGITSTEQIAVIRTIESTGDFDGITYDDIQFSTAVPEPLTIFGVGTAVAFGTAFKRKLRKAQKS